MGVNMYFSCDAHLNGQGQCSIGANSIQKGHGFTYRRLSMAVSEYQGIKSQNIV